MKAHVVKGRVFCRLFFLLAASLRGRGCDGCFEDRVLASPFSAFLSFVLEQLAMSFRRESCIRRGIRHEPVLIGCRIHPETCVPVRRVSRLAELGRTRSGRIRGCRLRAWRLVGLPLAQHPIACLGEMACDGDDGAAMSFAGSEPLIQTFNMGATIGLEPHRRVAHV